MSYYSSNTGADIDAAANLVKNGGTINGSLDVTEDLSVCGDLSMGGDGVATQSWVGQQGYLNQQSLLGYATQSWVYNTTRGLRYADGNDNDGILIKTSISSRGSMALSYFSITGNFSNTARTEINMSVYIGTRITSSGQIGSATFYEGADKFGTIRHVKTLSIDDCVAIWLDTSGLIKGKAFYINALATSDNDRINNRCVSIKSSNCPTTYDCIHDGYLPGCVTSDRILDLSEYSDSSFYPVITEKSFNDTEFVSHWDFEIMSQTRKSGVNVAQSYIKFKAVGCNLPDWNPYINPRFSIIDARFGSSTGNKIGCVGYSYSGTNTDSLRYVIWLRGGFKYRYSSNLAIELLTSSTNKDGEGGATYTVGTTVHGGTNTNIKYLYDPTSVDNGNTSGMVYHVKYGDTKFAQIESAISAGNIPVVYYDHRYYQLTHDAKEDSTGSKEYQFTCSYWNCQYECCRMDILTINSSSIWSAKNYNITTTLG